MKILHQLGLAAGCLVLVASTAAARAQLIGEPPIPPKKSKTKPRPADLEWLWQYSPPPAEGRENDLIQDPHFKPFLDQYFIAPQSFWGPNPSDPKAPTHKSLADTPYDFLVIPGRVIADENRYLTFTGAVRHFRTSRGLVFADLNVPQPLVAFAAIDWIRDSRTSDDPQAEFTMWIFPNMLLPGETQGDLTSPITLPPALARSLSRWAAEPLPGTGVVEHITAAILVDPDGTPHQIKVPTLATPAPEAPALPKRR